MGLEHVELAMEAEDEFGITIPDEALQNVVTVGDFHDLVVRLVRESRTTGAGVELRARPDLQEHLWSRIRVLAAQRSYDVTPEQIAHSTRFVEDLGYG